MLIVKKENGSPDASFTISLNSFFEYMGGAYSSVTISTSAALPWKKKTKLACNRHIFGTLLKCCVQMNVEQFT
tara:strand:+ start:512 stop:730 length:219 start_codon:yes stop_codon:yes gene_type:complete